MRVFTCNDFEGFYPVGSAAVVVAPDIEEARRMLDEKLREIGLKGLMEHDAVLELRRSVPCVVILCDGNY